jgi:TPR repeat protein
VSHPYTEATFSLANFVKDFLEDMGMVPAHELAMRGVHAAAMQGLAAAQFEVALMHSKGSRGEPDPAKAMEFLKRAAAQGLCTAEYTLGQRLLAGDGTAGDPAAAAAMWRSAAEHGLTPGDAVAAAALNNLGTMYANGDEGFPPDITMSIACFRKGADSGDPTGGPVE